MRGEIANLNPTLAYLLECEREWQLRIDMLLHTVRFSDHNPVRIAVNYFSSGEHQSRRRNAQERRLRDHFPGGKEDANVPQTVVTLQDERGLSSIDRGD